MKLIEITRTRGGEHGTFGMLLIDNTPQCVTLERPWKANEANISCIPAGFYFCKRIESPTYGDTFEIQDVPNGRKHCIFHWGNWVTNTKGCVLTGESFGKLKAIGQLKAAPAILSSKKAYNQFLHSLGNAKVIGLAISVPTLP